MYSKVLPSFHRLFTFIFIFSYCLCPKLFFSCIHFSLFSVLKNQNSSRSLISCIFSNVKMVVTHPPQPNLLHRVQDTHISITLARINTFLEILWTFNKNLNFLTFLLTVNYFKLFKTWSHELILAECWWKMQVCDGFCYSAAGRTLPLMDIRVIQILKDGTVHYFVLKVIFLQHWIHISFLTLWLCLTSVILIVLFL